MTLIKKLQAGVLANLVKPLLRRAGTAFAALLLAQGVDADTAQQIVTGLLALATVSMDLALSAINRRTN